MCFKLESGGVKGLSNVKKAMHNIVKECVVNDPRITTMENICEYKDLIDENVKGYVIFEAIRLVLFLMEKDLIYRVADKKSLKTAVTILTCLVSS